MTLETTIENATKKTNAIMRGIKYWLALTNGQRALLILNSVAIGFCLLYAVLVSWDLPIAIYYWPIYKIDWFGYSLAYIPLALLLYLVMGKRVSLVKAKSSLMIIILSLTPMIALSVALLISFISFFEAATGK